MNNHNRLTFWFFIGLALVTIIAGCSSGPQKTSKPSSDWSRGVAIGEKAAGAASLVADPDGGRMRLVWPVETGEGIKFRYLQLDANATPLFRRDLEIASGQLRTSRLIAAGEGYLHLFWAQRREGEKYWELWYTRLDSQGLLANEARRISAEEENVGSFALAGDSLGGVVVAWDRTGSSGVYGLRLSPDGELLQPASMLSLAGGQPDIRLDARGNLHMAWFDAGRLLYGRISGVELQPLEATLITEVIMGTGTTMEGPMLGLSNGWGYLFWSLLNRSGLEAGTAHVAYAAFPLDAPAYTSGTRLAIMPVEEQPEQAYQGDLPLTRLVPPPPLAYSSDYTFETAVISGQRSELAVALTVKQRVRLDEAVQVAVAIFEAGQFKGYQMAVKSHALSAKPDLAADAAGHFYLAWREGAVGENIYFAAATPAVRTALDRLDSTDVITALLQGGMEGLVGVLLLPIVGFGWLLPGGILIGLWKIFRDYDSLNETGSRVLLVIALLLYQGAKLITLPGVLSYVPFSAWLDVPSAWEIPLRVGVPVLIFAFGVWMAEWVRRRHSASAVTYYTALALSDAILTLGVYGVIFLGV